MFAQDIEILKKYDIIRQLKTKFIYVEETQMAKDTGKGNRIGN